MRHYLTTISSILRKQSKKKYTLLRTYLTIVTSAIFYHKIQRHFNAKKTFDIALFGFHIRFLDYPALLHLFQEIFIEEIYNFESDSPTPCIIDCGSNIGLSVIYFKMKYPEASILCFEPDKKIFEILEHNTSRNKLTGIDSRNLAVARDNSERAFFESSVEGSLSNSLFEIAIHRSSTHVKTVKLSNYISTSVDLLKLDIEGAEGEVIQELCAAGKMGHIKQVIFEYHKQSTISLGELITLLTDSGFKMNLARVVPPAIDVVISARKTHQ